MTVAISALLAVLLSACALLALGYLENHLKQMVFSQQSAMISAVAAQVDDKLRTLQTELHGLAFGLTPAMIAEPAGAASYISARPDSLAIFDNGVYLFSPAGKVMAAVPEGVSLPGEELRARDCIKRTVATGRPQIPDPFVLNQNAPRPVIMFTTPILDRNGKVIAVLGGSIDLLKKNFVGALSSVKLGEKGYLYLFDSSRTLLMHPDPSRVLKRDTTPGKNRLFDAATRGFEGTGETVNSRGVPMIASFKRLSSTGWILGGNLPQSEAYSPVYGAQRYVFLALVLALAASVLGVSLCTNHLVAPLLRVTAQVRELSEKKEAFGHRIEVKSENEIGVLADAFNAVLSELDAQKGELQRQLRFFRALIDTIPFPLFYKDTSGVFLGCNEAFERAFGMPMERLVGKMASDFQPDHLAEIYQKADEALLRERGVQVYEARVAFADGTEHDVIFHKGIYPAADGSPGGIVGSLLDITERKRSEEAHDKTRRQMQLILDTVEEGIYGLDLEGRVTFINPAAAIMSGFSQEELLGSHQHSTIHHSRENGGVYPVEECPIYATFRDGMTHHADDEVFWRKDGTSFPVEYASNPIVEDGRLVGAVVTFTDISQRKRAEEQLLMLSQALMQSPVGVLVTDTEGTIEYVNPKITEVYGYLPEEVIGENPRIFKSGQMPQEVYASLWETVRSGRVWSGEIHNMKKDGELFWERATIFPVRKSTGEIANFMAFKEDISEQKRLEAQLRQSQKMEAVGQLAGGVAHDFNNILTVIIGFGELLQHSLEKEDFRRKHMEQIIAAASRASHLTGSLLAFSRKQHMLLVPTDLNTLGRKHMKFLCRIIGEDVALHSDFGEQPLVVLADGGQIEQVLMNLATNARDAMPSGGTLRIGTQRVELDDDFCREHGCSARGWHVLLTVTDTGTGMDPQTLKKIFEPFFTTKETGRGTGLGLSIVYGIVKQHGGYITVVSERGVGTTFSVYLPEIAPAEEKVETVPLPRPEGGKETILLAEDEPAVRDLVRTVLKEFGYKVMVAHDGAEAVELYSRHADEIDLALFDVIMPKKSGKEACDELRAMNPALRVLLLSGYTADRIEDHGILAEGVELMMKPVQATALARKVREMLDA
ncbi:PAS domain S-box protein [Geomonas sp. RF6]|uniref:PAS domain S-box protein n=1 Tax=Geomonas sp. RF6 TaxID=2897342 RepID=UPI001E62567C|nr:PAS domain S-box protein [Geomonas sp. RF6]UFS69920.1 PAS domain S-box protein [Geomonas sp. RF6]